MITKEQVINNSILLSKVDTNLISDGFHTFGQLYEHRIELFITLCHLTLRTSLRDKGGKLKIAWKSKKHYDGKSFDGWFIAGIGTRPGTMITYHLPISRWDELKVRTFAKAPEWDGHTSEDVLQRLKAL